MHKHERLKSTASVGSPLRMGSLVGGVLMGLSYPPYGLSAFAWFSLVPLFISLRFSSARDVFLNAWLFYLACFTIAFWWPLTHVRMDTALISGVVWLALIGVLAVPFGLAGMISKRFPPAYRVWLAGALLLGLEWLLSEGPVTMPWTSIANTQLSMDAFVRGAAATGAEGLAVAIVLANILLSVAVARKRLMGVVLLVGAAAIPVSLWFAGESRHLSEPDSVLRVTVVQPAIDAVRWSDLHDASRIDSLISMSERAIDAASEPPDLILWPETALPIVDLSVVVPSHVARIQSLARTRAAAILTGAVVFKPSAAASAVAYSNSALLFSPDGTIRQTDKNRLVPFAEYVPFSNVFSWLGAFAVPAGGVAGYVPGTQSSILWFDGITLGVMICYESAFAGYAGGLASAGSELFVVLTQDGWWKGTFASIQHFEMGRFRAAEQGRSIVQVSVDGLSGLISADGTVIHRSRHLERETASYDVPIRSQRTFYSEFGRIGVRAFVGIWILSVGLYGLALFRKTTPNPT